jgi:hypothetical protein
MYRVWLGVLVLLSATCPDATEAPASEDHVDLVQVGTSPTVDCSEERQKRGDCKPPIDWAKHNREAEKKEQERVAQKNQQAAKNKDTATEAKATDNKTGPNTVVEAMFDKKTTMEGKSTMAVDEKTLSHLPKGLKEDVSHLIAQHHKAGAAVNHTTKKTKKKTHKTSALVRSLSQHKSRRNLLSSRGGHHDHHCCLSISCAKYETSSAISCVRRNGQWRLKRHHCGCCCNSLTKELHKTSTQEQCRWEAKDGAHGEWITKPRGNPYDPCLDPSDPRGKPPFPGHHKQYWEATRGDPIAPGKSKYLVSSHEKYLKPEKRPDDWDKRDLGGGTSTHSA